MMLPIDSFPAQGIRLGVVACDFTCVWLECSSFHSTHWHPDDHTHRQQTFYGFNQTLAAHITASGKSRFRASGDGVTNILSSADVSPQGWTVDDLPVDALCFLADVTTTVG